LVLDRLDKFFGILAAYATRLWCRDCCLGSNRRILGACGPHHGKAIVPDIKSGIRWENLREWAMDVTTSYCRLAREGDRLVLRNTDYS